MEAREMAEHCSRLSDKCLGIIPELNEQPENRSEVDHFLKGILVRHGIMLRDAALVLEGSLPEYRTSAFVIFRVLLEDIARAHYVLSASPKQEALDTINAQAYQYEFEQKRLFAQTIASEYSIDDHPSQVITTGDVDREQSEFIAHPANAKYVNNGKLKRFSIRQTDGSLIACLCRLDSRAYLTYKRLSQVVHYSGLTYSNERDKEHWPVDMMMAEYVVHKAQASLQVLERYLTGYYRKEAARVAVLEP